VKMRSFILFVGLAVGAGAYAGASVATGLLRFTEPLRTADATASVKEQGRVPISR
jgi:hypothetical protein